DNKISRCQGCEIHNMSNRVNCAFKRDISTNLYRIQIDSNKRVRAELNVLKKKITQQVINQPRIATSTLHFNPKIRRQQELIQRAIKEEKIQQELMEIREKVSQTNQQEHIVKMEVTEKRVDEERSEIVAVWKLENSNITFSQAVRTWPSKTKQILTAITCILLVIPNNHKVDIKVNQRMVQSIEEQRVKETTKGISSLLGKVKHWTSWATLYTISGRKNIGWSVTYSEQIQNMITQAENTRVFDLQHDNIRYDIYVMRWHDEQCPGNIRRFIRHLQNTMNAAHWQSQERLQKWNKQREKINWKLFYEYLNYGSRPLQRSTNPKESVGKSFKIKFFMDELPTIPTMENMYKRDKKKYKADTCRRCLKEVETNDHWIECRDNEISKDKLIFNAVSK